MPACYDLGNRYDITDQANAPRHNRYCLHYPTAPPALEVTYVTFAGAERHALRRGLLLPANFVNSLHQLPATPLTTRPLLCYSNTSFGSAPSFGRRIGSVLPLNLANLPPTAMLFDCFPFIARALPEKSNHAAP